VIHRRAFLATAVGGAAAAAAGCLDDEDGRAATIRGEALTLATTTSTYDTGVVDAVNAAFEARYGVTVNAVAQGTGAALETGRAGDADVVMVHARSLEDEFLRDGYGINRRDLMFNDFVVVGPDDDPAGVDDTESVTAAFRRSPRRALPSSRAATAPEPTARSSTSGTRPASNPGASGTARPAAGWERC